MANRFRVSKYKNQTLKLLDKPPKAQFTLSNVPNGGSNWVSASGYLYASLSGADEIAVSSFYPEQQKLMTIYSEAQVGLDFSPFHDDILAIACKSALKICRVPVAPTEDRSLHVKCADSGQFINWKYEPGSELSAVRFHPMVDSLLSTVEGQSHFSLYDFAAGVQSPLQTWNSGLRIKSYDFDYQGRLVALCGAQANEPEADSAFTIALHDVRAASGTATSKTTWNDLLSYADARILYLDSPSISSPHLLTSSIDRKKHRVVASWDVRSLTAPVATSVDFQVSTNIFMPLFDPSTGLVYFALKNGNAVASFEMDQIVSSAGFDVTGTAQSIPYSIKGVALASKRSLDVMQAEINRLLILTNNMVYPLSYHIPRKSYYDFHSDLYGDIRAPDCTVSAEQFTNPDNILPVTEPTVNLNPKVTIFLRLFRYDRDIGAKAHHASVGDQSIGEQESISKSSSNSVCSSSSGNGTNESSSFVAVSSPSGSKIHSQDSLESNVSSSLSSSSSTSDVPSNGKSSKPAVKPKPKPKPGALKKFAVVAKCKYLKGTIGNRETHLTNVMNICRNISPLCDPFKANEKYGFFPLGTGVGGGCNQVAIVDLRKPQRLSGGVQSHLLCSDIVTDFTLDPFNINRIAVGQLSGSVLIFNIYPPEGSNLNTDSMILDQYDAKLVGHNGRVTTVAFHPLANDIIATCATDNRVLIWELATEEILYEINLANKEAQLFSIAWSQYQAGGTSLAVLGRSRALYIFNVQTQELLQKGTLPYKVNNGRVCWISGDQLILVTGFNGLSERQFYLFNSADLSTGPLLEYGLDVSPSILVPTYDQDTRTLFLTGKGDSMIYTFEIGELNEAGTGPSSGAPSLITPLSHFEAPTPHQAIAFLPKTSCDVRRLEFANGFRLTANSIEPFSFVVPRLNMEYFHDDLFPQTTITWSPLFSSAEWTDLSCCTSEDTISAPERCSLKPDDMQNYSEVKDQLAAEKLEKSQSNRSVQAAANGQANGQAGFLDQVDGTAFMHNFSEMAILGREKQELLVEQISDMVEFNAAKTALESVEGVDPDEWDE